MRSAFDRRVLPDEVLDVVRVLQARVPCHLGGGAALSAAHLAHRLSADIDLFCHDAVDHRHLAGALPELGRRAGAAVRIVRDAGHLVRAEATARSGVRFALDLIHETVPDVAPPPAVLEGIVLESFADLRASKLTCILSRSEPRDLVDLFFLDRAGFPPERDLPLALQKDAGIDPGVIAWLLGQFPVRPLPAMLEPLIEADLVRFRDDLRARMRLVAVPD